MDIIEKAMLVYKENAYKKERFANMIERIGFENVEKAILDSDVLDRKEDIINMEIQKR
jgi:NAD(P)H-nitrite reductase large subunit